MLLIYAYIEKYKIMSIRKLLFDTSYSVCFENGILQITYNGTPMYQNLYHKGKPDNLHILIGKTGSGKTNLLQLIGAKRILGHIVGGVENQIHIFCCIASVKQNFFWKYVMWISDSFPINGQGKIPQFLKVSKRMLHGWTL